MLKSDFTFGEFEFLYTKFLFYNFGTFSFNEVQLLLPAIGGSYKIGAGILALSYIDENTVMSAGYDTFIRVFDLRSKRWYV